MSTPRRPSGFRKRPTPSGAGTLAVNALSSGSRVEDTGDETATEQVGAGEAELAIRRQFIENFEAGLLDEPGIDREDIAYIMQFFRQAIMDAPLGSGLTPARPEDFSEALNAMVAGGLLDETTRIDAERQIREALAPLDTEEVQLALEYARRLETDGEERALEWFMARRKEIETQSVAKKANGSPTAAAAAAGHATTRSRARRPRGPPKA